MNRKNFFFTAATSAALTVLLTSCARDVSREEMAKATEGYVEDTNKLFVVDCLLPGQVRRLGTQMTYLSQRRPIRTTAADCEVRGGEYVAYDRANYASALKIWLPKAQEGDAQAQNYVGQIFEKGLGQAVDYQAALQWYRKAADQGNSEAQLNLGHLYEKGLGVAKDPQAAMDWYRKAAGLSSEGLQFTPAIGDNKASTQEMQSLRKEADTLRAQLDNTRQQLMDQQDSLSKAQDDLLRAQQEIREKKNAPVEGGAELKALQEQLRDKERKLREQESRTASAMSTLNRERQAAKREIEAARKESGAQRQESNSAPASTGLEDALNDKISAYQKKSSELTQWLTSSAKASDEQLRSRIDTRKQELQADAREIAVLREKLEASRSGAGTGQQLAAANGPEIEIIEPKLTMTRGMPSIQISETAQGKLFTGKIKSTKGLKALLVNQQPVVTDAGGLFNLKLDQFDKDKPLEIVATDKADKQSTLQITLVTGSSSGQASFNESARPSGTGLGRSGDIAFGHYYALIIGNAEYPAYPQLKTPVADAKSIDVILRERYGFTTKLLINANRHAIMSALNEMNKKLTDKDNLLIYYAGHGEIDKASQTAYWLPTDAEVGNSANWISSQSITEFLSIMPAKHVMVVADSCYAGALTGSAVARLPDGIDEQKKKKWLQVMNSRKARTVLTSGGVKPVMDEGGGDHSIFAKALLSVLRSNQAILEDYEIFRAVISQVHSTSSSAGFEQTPQYAPLQHAGHEGSPFFFVPQV
jgi:predicted  nucleic acid-binding Zn-ribbon protein